MHSNQKLTKLIAGRRISGTTYADNLLTITFDDGSTMKVKVAVGYTYTAVTGDKIVKVQQQGTALLMAMETGSPLKIDTAEATSSVMLRDKVGKLEYTD